MKKMWKKGIGIICAGGLSAMCLAGCGKDVADSQEIPSREIQQNNVVDGSQANNNAADDGTQTNNNAAGNGTQTNNNAAGDGTQTNNNAADDETQTNSNAVDDGASANMGDGAFLYGANLQGDVVEFSDEGFSLSPATTEEVEGGGEVMVQTVPGLESDEDNIQVTYTDNTAFQIVNFSRSLQSEVSREDTDKESVKKQSSVCVFGSCQDTYHWTADKILIIRYQ